MYQENEIISLLLSIGLLIFVLMNRSMLRKLPAAGTLLLAFACLILSNIFTVLEGWFWPAQMNVLEHAVTALTTVLVTVWLLRFLMQTERR